MNESQERPFCIFDSHVKASDAIQPLARAGFDVTKLSLVGKGYHRLLAPAVFFLPSVGMVAGAA